MGRKPGYVDVFLPEQEVKDRRANGQWFYAFQLPPQTPSTPLPAKPANATPSPFGLVADQLETNGKKRTADDVEEVFDASVTKKTKSGKSGDLLKRQI
jgi:hypothetical protein